MEFNPDDIFEARRDAESLLVDTCTIERPTGAEVIDPASHKVTRSAEPVYPIAGGSGRCRVKGARTQANPAGDGGYTFTVQGSEVHIPIDAGPAKKDDLVTMTGCPYRPDMVGTIFRVVQVERASTATIQRLRVEELT